MTHDGRPRKMSIAEKMRDPPNRPKASFGCRHVQVILLTFGYFCCYAVRVALSISLVAMTQSVSANPTSVVYEWPKSVPNYILSAFFLGYVITHIPGGELAQRFGAKKFLGYGIGICGVMTMLIPAAAKYGGWPAVIVLRIITGACQGVIPPCIHTALSKWIPVEERGRAGTCTYSGGWLGNVIALLSCGAISESTLGWPGSFYIWGSITTFWAVLYLVLGKESPSDHPNIPLDEKEYIEISLGVTDTEEPLQTPWCAILTSIPVWATLIAQCSQAWGFWMLLTETPKYMADVLNYQIKENGLMMSLPYLAAWIMGFPISYTADKFVKKGYMSLNTMRKVTNTIGQCIPALALIAFSFVGSEQRGLAVGCLVLSVTFNVAVFSGHQMNHMDLSPNFAGTLMGITNAAANICSFMAPLICGEFVSDTKNIYQWRKVFILSAGIYILGNLIFVLFGTAKVQTWNETTKHVDMDHEISRIPGGPLSKEIVEEEEKKNENGKTIL